MDEDYLYSPYNQRGKTLSTPVKFPLSKKKIEPSFKLPSPMPSPRASLSPPLTTPAVFEKKPTVISEPKVESIQDSPPITPAQSQQKTSNAVEKSPRIDDTPNVKQTKPKEDIVKEKTSVKSSPKKEQEPTPVKKEVDASPDTK